VDTISGGWSEVDTISGTGRAIGVQDRVRCSGVQSIASLMSALVVLGTMPNIVRKFIRSFHLGLLFISRGFRGYSQVLFVITLLVC
jgi:hypothetical protein